MELENLEDLIDLAVSTEERFLFSELGEDAANSPDINSETILFLSEQNFGCSIPECLNLMSESLDGKGKGACKSKVSNFESISAVNK